MPVTKEVVFGPQTPVTFLIHHDVRKSFKDERGESRLKYLCLWLKCCPCSRGNSR
uniref:Uncharacterized protein n=1 Tax=Anguilla anguilla TaxID=7936 RepID=A0A0E9XCF9_ANGAN